MITIILPGGSPHNKKWLEETAKGIGAGPDTIGVNEIRPIYWSHWDDSEKKFDPKEKARLLNSVAGPRLVNIIAKSIGTLAASYMIQSAPEKIRKVIFCGLPLNDIGTNAKDVIESAIKLVLPEDILCFQNENDPHGSFKEIKNFLFEINPGIKVIPKDRNDHEYFYIDEFRNYLIS